MNYCIANSRFYKYFDKQENLSYSNNLTQSKEVPNFCNIYCKNVIKIKSWSKEKTKKFRLKFKLEKYIKFDKSYIAEVIQWFLLVFH